MLKCFVLGISIVSLSILIAGGASAQTKSGIHPRAESDLRDFIQKSRASRAVLESKAQADWTENELEEYLTNSLYAVYSAALIYNREFRSLPADSDSLRNSGYMAVEDWPGNPFNSWEPIIWKASSFEFEAGNLVLQPCPPDWYSVPESPRPRSFTLSILGPTEDYQPLSPPSALFDWATVPRGAVLVVGARYPSVQQTLDKRKKVMEQQSEAQQ
ncbi:hypothetical protein IT575_00995 [bacterium]|nr:hypothetical protein [bacterium]